MSVLKAWLKLTIYSVVTERMLMGKSQWRIWRWGNCRYIVSGDDLGEEN